MNPKSIYSSRKAFERWMGKAAPDYYGIVTFEDGSYVNGYMQHMWMAWQASEKRLTRKKR